jgi:hypothetical protein
MKSLASQTCSRDSEEESAPKLILNWWANPVIWAAEGRSLIFLWAVNQEPLSVP